VWTGRAGAAAVAACLLVATGVWLSQRSAATGGGTSVADNGTEVSRTVVASSSTQPVFPAAGTVRVAVMGSDQPATAVAAVGVEIGPSAGVAKLNLPAREALTPSRSTVAIDSAILNAQDSDHSPFR
jgi:archaellin